MGILSLKEAKQLIVDAHKLQQQIKDLSSELELIKSNLHTFFDANPCFSEQKKLEVEGKSKVLVAKKVKRVRLDFIVDKMREQFPRDIFDRCVTKSYSLNNVSNFIKLLKQYGMQKEQFLEYIDVSYKVNTQLVRDLYARRELLPGELADTFTAKVTSYIEITAETKA